MKSKLIILISLVITIIIITNINYNSYSKIYNDKILALILESKNQNPNLDLSKLAIVLKENTLNNNDVLTEYGFNSDDIHMIKQMSNTYNTTLYFNIIIIIIVTLIGLVIYILYKRKQVSKLTKVINYLEQINNGNYDLELEGNDEDVLSALKNQIYKTTTILKQQNNSLKEDKKIIKNSMVDISHQLKTPLTSVKLMLESVISDKSMDKKIKEEFLKDCLSKIDKINFLVITLLKLSRLDAKVIEFKKEQASLKSILESVISNVSYLISESNIKINLLIDKNIIVNVDRKWQEEALTNIVKNAIEHSKKGGLIDIKATKNTFYINLEIKDYGTGMTKEQLKKIFTRYNKSNDTNKIGVGLNLAKGIIEEDNGMISVDSKVGGYTLFKVKYPR